MKTTLLATVSAIMIATTPMIASAQNNPGMKANSSMAATTMEHKLIGYDIVDVKGDDLGDVKEVIIDQNGKPTAVIAAVGGFFGINDKRVEIKLTSATVNDEDEEVRVQGWTEAEIESLPDYEG